MKRPFFHSPSKQKVLLFFIFLFPFFIFCQKKHQSIYPRFVGCENKNLADSLLMKCSEEAFLSYLYQNITPPKKYYKKDFMGKAVVDFGIDEDGKVIRAIIKKIKRTDKYQREQEAEFAKEVLKVINKMPNWIIDKSVLRPLHPWFTVSVNFQQGSFSIKVDKRQVKISQSNKVSKRELPRFPGCENKGKSIDELRKCAEGEMMKFIYGNIKYPINARNNKTEGKVIAQFIVLKDGSIGNIEILRDIGDGCGKEVQRVINLMNVMKKRWTPGPSRGRPITVKFTLPVVFKFSSPPIEKNK